MANLSKQEEAPTPWYAQASDDLPDDVYVCTGKNSVLIEQGADMIILEKASARALRDWLNKVLL